MDDQSHFVTTLGQAILLVNKWPTNGALLLPVGEDWSAFTQSIVMVRDPYGDDDPSAVVDGVRFEFALRKEQVEDLLCNTQQQLPTVSEEQAFLAFLFYFARDAFIDWTQVFKNGVPSDVLNAASPSQE